jgi:murein DD-endopeptidase MepM/ murein hydrolase activator NlpD
MNKTKGRCNMSKRDFFEDDKKNKTITIFFAVLVISVIAFFIVFSMYNKKLKEEANLSVLNIGIVNTIVPNDVNAVVTSSSQDKTVNNSMVNNTKNTVNATNSSNILENKNVNNNSNSATNTEKNTSKNNTSSVENVAKTNSEEAVQKTGENAVEENSDNINDANNNLKSVDEFKFAAPVSGEILKDYASDSLIYSNTLEEWTTHLGIDIKAERTTVVAASEDGTIESIKNDPRYGLTITINHGNGYKTIYSNLLTTEFVKVGDEVERGQTIATVGDSASFEILDEPHLHFEMNIDGESVNPTAYFK